MDIFKGRGVILASARPRRRELLAQIGVIASVRPAAVAELVFHPGDHPGELVRKNALLKAKAAVRMGEQTLIIAGDTLVFVAGAALGKPRDAAEAIGMLQALSGKTHQVYSGLCLVDQSNGRQQSAYSCTAVEFARLSPGMIADYVASGEPLDKAGA
ncbi:MAG: Maf family protein, partial [Clostridiales bacterium]